MRGWYSRLSSMVAAVRGRRRVSLGRLADAVGLRNVVGFDCGRHERMLEFALDAAASPRCARGVSGTGAWS
jgi:hypothetical protein